MRHFSASLPSHPADGKDFKAATITLNFGLIEKRDTASDMNFDPKFKSFAGLLGKANAALRVAEVFGHEASHAVFAINNPADAVKLQLLINDAPNRQARAIQYEAARKAIKNKNDRKKFLPPPDIAADGATQDKMFEVTERFAQAKEKVISTELVAGTKKKKK